MDTWFNDGPVNDQDRMHQEEAIGVNTNDHEVTDHQGIGDRKSVWYQ